MRLLASLALLIPLLLPVAAHAQNAAVEQSFQRWLAAKVKPDARNAGVSDATIAAAFAGLTLDWKLPDLAPPGAPPGREEPQRQAEFSGPARYFNEAKLAGLTNAGRARYQQWSKTLSAIEKRYGVPASILVAIWGRESGYGAAKIPYSAIRTLATEAFMGARKANFYPELIAALQILEGDHIPLSEMRSSWAGALGQPQFLPTKYLTTAVDFDGDGRRDIWESVPDVLASIANYLKQNGWEAGAAWGVEVSLPDSVSCSLEGPDQGKPLGAWEAMGIRTLDGKPLAGKNAKRIGHLMMPAGRYGPAFIVSKNFYILKTYNNSDLYALFIGHLADRIRGGSAIAGAWGDVGGFKRSDVRAMQKRLQARGVDVGNPDGLVGYKTRIAIGEWQQANGHNATCFPDTALLKAIR
ncbi:lytic murein transglycosylase [Kaistia algarum]|uniref:lytic murein transglycosylase n=1 Tax=Kaistia algarum TaxID=2083279 RepID=UPI000CE927E8|nr:lytic murein transglycosylase [Kaistia algarum]MCX5515685.1 lytic murein transglycosylase [Kaistia algarum]PPE80933.1 lytic murein transglycosylase [Kaistia algarum]